MTFASQTLLLNLIFRGRLSHSPCSNGVSLHITVLTCLRPLNTLVMKQKFKNQQEGLLVATTILKIQSLPYFLFEFSAEFGWIGCGTIPSLPVSLLGFWRPHHSSYHPLHAPLFSCLFHHLSSGRIMQSLSHCTGRGILTPQMFNKSARLHYCSGQEALPWHGNWEQTIREHEGTEGELPKLLFSASSWIHMAQWVWMQHQLWQTRGTSCTAPSVPLSISVAFLKGKAQGTVLQSPQGSPMEGLGEMGRSMLVPW